MSLVPRDLEDQYHQPLLSSNEEQNPSDYVIVFPYQEDDKPSVIQFREEMKQSLEGIGLLVESSLSRDGDEIFFLISAPKSWIEKYAEFLELEFELKSELGGAYAQFTVQNRRFFPEDCFTSLKRQQIIHTILESPKKKGGLGYDFDNLINQNKLSHFFPLHDADSIQYLMDEWIKQKSLYLPLNHIRNYFGEKIALYFAFLQTYTLWLIVPSIIGLPLFMAQVLVDDSVYSAAFSIFMSLWLTAFFTKWRRQTSVHTFEWNTMSLTKADRQRPEFYGDERIGFYSKSGFVSLEQYPKFQNEINLYYPKWKRNLKYFIVTPIIGLSLIVVITGTFGLIFAAVVEEGFKPFSGAANAVFIIFMNAVYSKVAQKVTDWENHRTDNEYENALILKTFAFQFVNSYISLFYIAFIKSQNFDIFGKELKCQYNGSCLKELQIQLASIFLIQMFWGQFQEVAVPFLTSKVLIFLEDRKLSKRNSTNTMQHDGGPPTLSGPESQSKLPRFPGLMQDYNEMLIQMGYITLFSAAFPVAPLAALLNNLVEMRTDGIKLMKTTQRPHYEGASDIGSWQPIMALLSIVCILTNCGLIYLTLDEWSFQATVLLENILLFLKFQLDIWFEPLPPDVVKAIAKRGFLKQFNLNESVEIESSSNPSINNNNSNNDNNNNSNFNNDDE